ncbi:antitoxin HicB [Winslowiella iniecta]|uniref:Antitoxin HicB n=1 Tax=Winslowiella iniecta TaxID=1560201 RepID=A0A0L7T0K4_9GAMM|nr:antitoxin HicB [Winslowiella iniecta]KOC88999.1 antitoxin HicB [Winslowiella iniecta]KOC92646.1 antitoxin HicB [Winslowiella iniecta]
MYKYPASVSFDEETGTWEIVFRDFETLPSVALSEDDIELEATEGLIAAIGDSIDSRKLIPHPSGAAEGDILVYLPLLTCLKAALSNSLINTGTRKAELARKMSMNGSQTDRLLDVSHASKVETLEQALYLLGFEVSVSVTAI